MGKGDRSVGNSGSAPHGETVRSRHFSSNGLTSPPATTLQLRKPRCPNGFSIPWFPRSQGKYAVTEKKEKEMSWQLRSSVVLMILLLTNLINYMDRYTIAGVLEDVQKFYSINNAQAGLLQTSFIMSYMLLSPIFGYLGDRYNRVYIMAAGVLFWSLITLAGSFIPREQFWLFLAMRALVGVGEASYSTIAPTIIADMFNKAMRTKALSIFYFAIPVGSGLGYIVGSKVAEALDSWQWALRVTPVLGVICTVMIVFMISEPPRGAADGGLMIRPTSWLSDVKYLLKHKSFMLSTLGFTCVAFVAGALALWAPTYMSKSLLVNQIHTNANSVSLIFGVITCAAGITGVSLGLYLAGLLRKVTKKADPLICGIGLISSAPFLYLAIVMSSHDALLTWILIFIAETLLSLNWAIVTDILMYIVIPTRRSSAEAVQILLSHALGDAGSPYLVGLTSDVILASYDRHDVFVEYLSLQYALYVSCFVCVLGGAFFLATALFIQRDREQTEKLIKAAGVCIDLAVHPVALENGEDLAASGDKLDESPTDSASSTAPSDSTSEDSVAPSSLELNSLLHTHSAAQFLNHTAPPPRSVPTG